MGKQPTTLPRWAIILQNSALVITVIAGAVVFGRSASKTEAALDNAKQVPALAASFETLNLKLDNIASAQASTSAQQNARLAKMESEVAEVVKLNNSVQTLAAQVTALTGQMGSVWALAQSDSNKVSELKGMVQAMQSMQQQQRQEQKEK